MGDVKQIIPKDSAGFLKNITELMVEYRNGNIQCCMLAYRRKDTEGTRVYFIGNDDPHMFRVLKQLENDMLGLVEMDADVYHFGPWEES